MIFFHESCVHFQDISGGMPGPTLLDLQEITHSETDEISVVFIVKSVIFYIFHIIEIQHPGIACSEVSCLKYLAECRIDFYLETNTHACTIKAYEYPPN